VFEQLPHRAARASDFGRQLRCVCHRNQFGRDDDPLSTYLGGSGFDAANSIAVDSTGAAYIAGQTESANFPTTVGPPLGGVSNAFVTKLNPNETVAYSRFLGSDDFDVAFGIALEQGCELQRIRCRTNQRRPFPDHGRRVSNLATRRHQRVGYVTERRCHDTGVFDVFGRAAQR
jgi:hypothetical protein